MLLDGSSENEEENVDNEQSDSGEDDDASNDSDTSAEDDDDTATGGDKSGSEDDGDEKEASGKKASSSPRLANRFRELTGSLKEKNEENASLMKKMEQMQSEMENLKRGGTARQEKDDDEEIDISSLTSDPKELSRIQEFMKLQEKARKLSKNKDATPAQIKSLMDQVDSLKKASETIQKQSAQQADQAALKKVIDEYADVIDADELEARVYNQIYEWEHSSDPREKVLAQAPWKKIVKLVLDEDELDEKEAEKIKAKKKKTAKKIDTEKDSDEKITPASEKRERWNPGDPIGSREAMMARMREKLRAANENE